MLESLFNKAAGLGRLDHKCFSMIFAKFPGIPYNETNYAILPSGGSRNYCVIFCGHYELRENKHANPVAMSVHSYNLTAKTKHLGGKNEQHIA